MKTAFLFGFVGAFLVVPTLGIFEFIADDPARTDEYENADLRTMFGLISADLALGRRVLISTPATIFTPPEGSNFRFRTDISDPNNNWIDDDTGVPYQWTLDGRHRYTSIEQETIRVVALETTEETNGDDSSLRFDLTVRIQDLEIVSLINCNGTWRFEELNILNGNFAGSYINVEVRYQARFNLERNPVQRAGQWFLGQLTDLSLITVEHVTTTYTDITDQSDEILVYWEPEEFGDGDHVDGMAQEVMTSALQQGVATIDSLVRQAFGDRPYIAPPITMAVAAFNASGFSCEGHSSRRRRRTKLYNLLI